jgi:CelD/BcsL family acetyltransferase involved in cellulose biosynthesis
VTVHVIDPLQDERWARLVDAHPRASVFHSNAWLEALHRTYGYTPQVLTTAPGGTDLTAGIPVCEIGPWFSTRLVSLPFSDHCEPLVGAGSELAEVMAFVHGTGAGRRRKSLEVRPRYVRLASANGWGKAATYCLHTLDLSDGTSRLFGRFHPSCVQRAIRRAEREGLAYEAGSSPALLADFYGLLRLTRRRHGMPPQPFAWFRNLADRFGDRLTVRTVSKRGRPVAGILTLTFKKTMVYKYGGSDARVHSLGGMPYLFWRAIQEAVHQNLEEFDLGRSDWNQPGLLTFKDRLGARRSTLVYYRNPAEASDFAGSTWKRRAARRLVASIPEPAAALAGRVLYRYLG